LNSISFWTRSLDFFKPKVMSQEIIANPGIWRRYPNKELIYLINLNLDSNRSRFDFRTSPWSEPRIRDRMKLSTISHNRWLAAIAAFLHCKQSLITKTIEIKKIEYLQPDMDEQDAPTIACSHAEYTARTKSELARDSRSFAAFLVLREYPSSLSSSPSLLFLFCHCSDTFLLAPPPVSPIRLTNSDNWFLDSFYLQDLSYRCLRKTRYLSIRY